jgi:hypothetical protein
MQTGWVEVQHDGRDKVVEPEGEQPLQQVQPPHPALRAAAQTAQTAQLTPGSI